MAAVTWEVWNRWSPDQRARYRARHRNEWEQYRPRSAAGTPADPVDPGSANTGEIPHPPPPAPPAAPFLTPEQQQAINDFLTSSEAEIIDLDATVRQASSDRDYALGFTDEQGVFHKGTIDREQDQSREAVIDNSIGRGIFQSSIRDGEIADVEAARVRRRQQFQDNFNILKGRVDERKRNLARARELLLGGYDPNAADPMRTLGGTAAQQAVVNAQNVPVTPRTPTGKEVAFTAWSDAGRPPGAPAPTGRQELTQAAASQLRPTVTENSRPTTARRRGRYLVG